MLVFKLDFEAKLLVRFWWNFELVEILFKDWYKFFFDFVEELGWKLIFISDIYGVWQTSVKKFVEEF